MNKSQFEAYLSEGYNRVPLVREILADLDTPLSTYLKLANGPYSYLFESVQGGEKWGRYSIIGLPAKTIIKVTDRDVDVITDGETVSSETVSDPLEWIENYKDSIKVPEIEGMPRFNGGLVGYFGYETIRYIEPKLSGVEAESKPDPIDTPDILLMLSEEVVIFDNLNGILSVIVHASDGEYEDAERRLDYLSNKLQEPLTLYNPVSNPKTITEDDFVSGFTKEGFEEAVEKTREYIKAGDAMQVVLSQRLSIPFEAPPIDLYRSLRSFNPSPYMHFMNLDSFQIVGSSPEILVRLDNGEITVRPIAGTRKRGHDKVKDLAMEKELLNDPKELAEHLMLIDLGRNDAGRVSQTGSVRLTNKMGIERYSHVMHIVSNVVGKLLPDMSAIDVLRATFPAGTVSGAPKIRAMEIIDELEPVKRGIYSGAIGYLAWNGNMDTAIAIRTGVIKDETLHIQAGAGIVYDSVPEMEWMETMNKARAIFKAVSQAAAGLDRLHK
ncbi:anthranilate synthase component I [Cocleimonas sp. KMM 6892]|uniref:anthranilate synthase component I n=1 Tax=unclassified Cocleimonas TaxID=2639732 RepID=UPI002DBAC991|nr:MULTISPECIES: anthranilate synthase component I [unclassified Cocleimonas]MEB8431989.1 anthranilate synthase component I [Cocleimonas sp. KMM 6892]MEC4714925.1 anthranilate synthase component I [Cocleimonas sp. KMM 6895]MEC4744261.1 anthranilate synthase component I [Cocleimonas sp. KMM 6896]